MADRSSTTSLFRSLPWPEPLRQVVKVGRTRRSRWQNRRFRSRLAGPKILSAFAERYPDAFFVEIGANDGEQHDHLRPFLAQGSWRGIMVEPVPYVFERLRANLRDLPQITLENVAIADRDGAMPFFHLRPSPNHVAEGLPRWYDGIGSFSREAVLSHAPLLPDIEDWLVWTEVPCLTFDSLCAKHAIDRVDLLLVDTEGYDYQLLQTISLHRHRPRLLVFEHYHLTAAERHDLREKLERLGYELMEEGFDTWCLDSRPDDALCRLFRRVKPGLRAQSVSEDR